MRKQTDKNYFAKCGEFESTHILHVSDLKSSTLDRSTNLTICFCIILSDCIKSVHLKKTILIISIKNTFFHFNFSFFSKSFERDSISYR